MIRCFIAVGSNLGDRAANLRAASRQIGDLPDSSLGVIAPVYQNPAIGPGDQPDYLNTVLELNTTLSASTLLAALQTIETQLGRRREIRWGARTIDLDILLYGNAFISTGDLQIPHPRMLQRNFVLYPLFDIAPELQLPDSSSLRSHLDSCPSHGLTRLALSLQE